MTSISAASDQNPVTDGTCSNDHRGRRSYNYVERPGFPMKGKGLLVMTVQRTPRTLPCQKRGKVLWRTGVSSNRILNICTSPKEDQILQRQTLKIKQPTLFRLTWIIHIYTLATVSCHLHRMHINIMCIYLTNTEIDGTRRQWVGLRWGCFSFYLKCNQTYLKRLTKHGRPSAQPCSTPPNCTQPCGTPPNCTQRCTAWWCAARLYASPARVTLYTCTT